MYCRNCGKEIRKGAAFCASCGTKIEIEEDYQQSIQTEIVEEIIVPEEKIESLAPNTVIYGIILATMIISVCFIVFL